MRGTVKVGTRGNQYSITVPRDYLRAVAEGEGIPEGLRDKILVGLPKVEGREGLWVRTTREPGGGEDGGERDEPWVVVLSPWPEGVFKTLMKGGRSSYINLPSDVAPKVRLGQALKAEVRVAWTPVELYVLELHLSPLPEEPEAEGGR